jgi:hypothetical protein
VRRRATQRKSAISGDELVRLHEDAAADTVAQATHAAG